MYSRVNNRRRAKRKNEGPWINIGRGKFGKKNNRRAGKI